MNTFWDMWDEYVLVPEVSVRYLLTSSIAGL
jgi:hypothetical protein